MAARAALPISVRAAKDPFYTWISVQDRREMAGVPLRDRFLKRWNAGWAVLNNDHRRATAAYFTLVEAITPCDLQHKPAGNSAAGGAIT